MRLHLVIAGAVFAGILGWFALQQSSGVSDPPFTRDRIVTGNVVATFKTDSSEGYRFTMLPGEGWIWERVDYRGRAQPDILLNNGSNTLLQIAPQCWVTIRDVRMPFVPGVTVSHKLKGKDGVHKDPDNYYRYEIDPGLTAPILNQAAAPELRGGMGSLNGASSPDALLSPAGKVEVIEDLRPLETGPGFRATTSPTGTFWYGSYDIRPALDSEVLAARSFIANATPSQAARMQIRERVLESTLTSQVAGPYTLVVASECPDTPMLMRSSANGGQRGGVRVTTPPVQIVAGENPVLERVVEVPFTIYVDSLNLELAAKRSEPATVEVRQGLVASFRTRQGVLMAWQFVTCDPQPFFQC